MEVRRDPPEQNRAAAEGALNDPDRARLWSDVWRVIGTAHYAANAPTLVAKRDGWLWVAEWMAEIYDRLGVQFMPARVRRAARRVVGPEPGNSRQERLFA